MLWTFGNSRDIFHLVNSFTGGDIMTQKVLELDSLWSLPQGSL